MKRKLLLLVCWVVCLLATFTSALAQQIYGQHNVTQDVFMSSYFDTRPLRVMEYSTDQAGTIIERRLEVLPENDLPSIQARVLTDNFEILPFINKPPFDASFDDGIPDFKLAASAAALLFGTEVSLEIIKDKFGWIGIDNLAANGKPILWNIVNPGKPLFVASAAYNPFIKEFLFRTDGNQPEQINHIDVVGHELVHAIIHQKVGNIELQNVDPCAERWVLEEALGDIIVIQVAKDAAFTNIVRSQTVPSNTTTIEFALPSLPNQTDLFVQVLPQKGVAFGICNNTYRVQTDENATVPAMKSPAKGTNFPFRNFVSVFGWKGGTLNLNLVDHFEVWVTENTFGLTSIFSTQGKVFDFALQDQFMFDDKMGIQVKVLAVGPHGSKSGFSETFNYNICPDHPEIIFPVDQISKVDALQDFVVKWKDSFWFDPGSEYKVTIKDGGVPVPGFNNKSTTASSMLVPAGTLINGKQYSLTVLNSSSCAGIVFQANIFSTVGSGGSNQPQPPKLVDFTIELKGYRNDQDGLAWETSDYVLGFELLDPDGNVLGLIDPNDPNGNQITQLDVDSENSGVILAGNNKPQGTYKLRLKMKDIFSPLLYYPFDQPRYSVFLNGKPIINPHVITANFADPNSFSHEWKIGFQFGDIILDIK